LGGKPLNLSKPIIQNPLLKDKLLNKNKLMNIFTQYTRSKNLIKLNLQNIQNLRKPEIENMTKHDLKVLFYKLSGGGQTPKFVNIC